MGNGCQNFIPYATGSSRGIRGATARTSLRAAGTRNRSLEDICKETKKDMKKQEAMAKVQTTSCDQKRSKLPDPDTSLAVTCPLCTSSKIRRNFAQGLLAVFFCHAQLYVLGDKYDVKPLKTLFTERLSRSLRQYGRAEAPSADFLGLVRYIFEHTPQRNIYDVGGESCQSPHKLSGDILQQICVRFAANKVPQSFLGVLSPLA